MGSTGEIIEADETGRWSARLDAAHGRLGRCSRKGWTRGMMTQKDEMNN